MKIIHFVPLNNVTANGILPAALGLAEAQHHSHDFDVLVVDIGNFENFNDVGSYFVSIVRLTDFQLNQNVADIAIFHGIYHLPYIRIAKELYDSSIPYVVVPHSSLTRRGQKVRWWKKIFGNVLWFRPFCERASSVQFLTVGEQEESVKWCASSFVLPNGVNLLSRGGRGSQTETLLRFLYLGRYDVNQKGLDVLVEALRKMSPLSKERCEFIFYGTNYRGGRGFLDEALEGLVTDGVNMTVHGPAYGEDKESVYSDADVFLLTSRFEGHPIGLLEAMSAGLPVLITEHTNIASEVEQANGGWIVDLDPVEIARTIDEVASLSLEEIAQVGDNAADMATNCYSWSVIVPQSLSHYREIIEKG